MSVFLVESLRAYFFAGGCAADAAFKSDAWFPVWIGRVLSTSAVTKTKHDP